MDQGWRRGTSPGKGPSRRAGRRRGDGESSEAAWFPFFSPPGFPLTPFPNSSPRWHPRIHRISQRTWLSACQRPSPSPSWPTGSADGQAPRVPNRRVRRRLGLLDSWRLRCDSILVRAEGAGRSRIVSRPPSPLPLPPPRAPWHMLLPVAPPRPGLRRALTAPLDSAWHPVLDAAQLTSLICCGALSVPPKAPSLCVPWGPRLIPLSSPPQARNGELMTALHGGSGSNSCERGPPRMRDILRCSSSWRLLSSFRIRETDRECFPPRPGARRWTCLPHLCGSFPCSLCSGPGQFRKQPPSLKIPGCVPSSPSPGARRFGRKNRAGPKGENLSTLMSEHTFRGCPLQIRQAVTCIDSIPGILLELQTRVRHP
ncbi:hypothetical protein Cadr_000030700 [Camelus dromedarius]|uniref:Uncharacterized protein n=1 Tax=Camelus dromedarius TaxID=9838 RepID=A0A5N4BZL1_CAMDR|nr:hypothetical protein Cadr_000030700 [Camelus dromedarius]